MSAIPMHIETEAQRPARDKAVKILAKTLYRELRGQGFEQRHLVALATELISQVTEDKTDR